MQACSAPRLPRQRPWQWEPTVLLKALAAATALRAPATWQRARCDDGSHPAHALPTAPGCMDVHAHLSRQRPWQRECIVQLQALAPAAAVDAAGVAVAAKCGAREHLLAAWKLPQLGGKPACRAVRVGA
eukprot:32411-Chlamydomonas_euryale.AAC.1